MRRVIGIDIHRTFGEVVIWEDGRLRHAGRIDMTRTALEGFGKKLVATDEVVIEATGNAWRCRGCCRPFVKRVVIGDCQGFCVWGHSDADGGRAWSSRRTHWISCLQAVIPRMFLPRTGWSMS